MVSLGSRAPLDLGISQNDGYDIPVRHQRTTNTLILPNGIGNLEIEGRDGKRRTLNQLMRERPSEQVMDVICGSLDLMPLGIIPTAAEVRRTKYLRSAFPAPYQQTASPPPLPLRGRAPAGHPYLVQMPASRPATRAEALSFGALAKTGALSARAPVRDDDALGGPDEARHQASRAPLSARASLATPALGARPGLDVPLMIEPLSSVSAAEVARVAKAEAVRREQEIDAATEAVNAAVAAANLAAAKAATASALTPAVGQLPRSAPTPSLALASRHSLRPHAPPQMGMGSAAANQLTRLKPLSRASQRPFERPTTVPSPRVSRGIPRAAQEGPTPSWGEAEARTSDARHLPNWDARHLPNSDARRPETGARPSRFALPASDAAAPAMTPGVFAALPAEPPTQPSRLSGTQGKQDVPWSASAIAPAPAPTVGVLTTAPKVRGGDDVNGGDHAASAEALEAAHDEAGQNEGFMAAEVAMPPIAASAADGRSSSLSDGALPADPRPTRGAAPAAALARRAAAPILAPIRFGEKQRRPFTREERLAQRLADRVALQFLDGITSQPVSKFHPALLVLPPQHASAHHGAPLPSPQVSKFHPALLTSACEALILGLRAHPHDELLDWGFHTSAEHFKYVPPARWARWPFDERVQRDQTARRRIEPPGTMPPPICARRTLSTLLIDWPEYVPRPDIEDDGCDGYTLEMAGMCPLDGPSAWRRVAHGAKLTALLRGIGPERDVLLRVRAYNNKGGGPWSDVTRTRVLMPTREPPKELETIPESWWALDIDDLLKQMKLEEGTMATQSAMESLFAVLHEYRSAIKIAFRYYSLVGSSGVGESAGLMYSTQFLNFVKGASDLLNDASPVRFIVSDVDLIYKRSIRELSAEAAAATPIGYSVKNVPGAPGRKKSSELSDAAVLRILSADVSHSGGDGDDQEERSGDAGGGGLEWRKTKNALKVTALIGKKGGSNLMNQQQFVAGLLRLASRRYERLPSLGARVRALLEDQIVGHVTIELDLVNDSFSRQMAMQPMAAVLRKHRADCERFFRYYAGVDKSLGAETTTMNMRELLALCEDARLFIAEPGKTPLSQREMVSAFARVNVEDELYEQDDQLNTSTELVFDEFFEALARMYRAKDWAKKPIDADEGLEFARGFHGWLLEELEPKLLAAIKVRKMAM